jgi:hypothetical protein
MRWGCLRAESSQSTACYNIRTPNFRMYFSACSRLWPWPVTGNGLTCASGSFPVGVGRERRHRQAWVVGGIAHKDCNVRLKRLVHMQRECFKLGLSRLDQRATYNACKVLLVFPFVRNKSMARPICAPKLHWGCAMTFIFICALSHNDSHLALHPDHDHSKF